MKENPHTNKPDCQLSTVNCRLSVVVPYLNRADYLPRTLESILKQTFRPFELILVDNGSTDGSTQICKDFCKAHENEGVTFRLSEIGFSNAAAARNQGAKVAGGEWIAFFDSDDEMSADFLEDVAKQISSGKYDMIGLNTRLVFENGKTKVRKSYFNDSVSDQILTGMLSTVSFVVKKDFLESVGGWDEKLRIWDDWELGIRLLVAHPRIKWIRKKTYHNIYFHHESITGEKFSTRADRYAEAFKSAFADIKKLTGKEYKKAKYALHAREDILAGHLHKEGFPIADYKPKYPWLYNYTRFIGKGAWWIYRLLA